MLDALTTLQQDLGVDIDPDIKAIDINADPSLDELSPYNVADGWCSLLMMNGLLCANIWAHKTGTTQTVTIDQKRAMEMMYRPNFIHINDVPLSLDAFKRPESLTHKTKDGFFETTTALTHLHDETLDLLNCAPNKAAIDAAYQTKTADEWELLFNERGLAGTKIRTRKEFREHPQGQALSQVSPFEVTALNDSPGRPFAASKRPLSDIKVLDLTLIIAGPSLSTNLAEQGANVLHIANPKAERVKSNYLDTGFGKRSAYLDLNDSAHLARLHELIRESDVFVNGYAPGRLAEKFGLSDEQLLTLNPGLIIAHSSAWGHVGPWALRPGWENVAQAAIGSCIDHGSETEPCICPYGFLTDYSTGLAGSIAVLKAIHQRALRGGAQRVDISLARTGMWYQDQGLKARKGDMNAEHAMMAKTLNGGNISEHSQKTDTPYGVITHLKPVLEYSQTPANWDKPTAPLGSSKAEW